LVGGRSVTPRLARLKRPHVTWVAVVERGPKSAPGRRRFLPPFHRYRFCLIDGTLRKAVESGRISTIDVIDQKV